MNWRYHRLPTSGLIDHRNTLEDIRIKALNQSSALDEPIREIAEQVAKLGPAPPADRTESVEIEAQRKLLNDVLNRLQGAKTQLELVGVEAEQQAGRASSIQRNQFFQKIFESSRSILNPYLWSDAGAGLDGVPATSWGLDRQSGGIRFSIRRACRHC